MAHSVDNFLLLLSCKAHLQTDLFKDCRNAFMEKFTNDEIPTKLIIHRIAHRFSTIWSIMSTHCFNM
jgi:hypothetical protein